MRVHRAQAFGAARGAHALDGAPASAPTNSLLQWALLGLLIERPSYGYELAHRFERTFGGILRLSGVSYVYTALDGLRRRGLIEEVEVGDERRMPRVHYRTTATGVSAYRERLFTQMRENDRHSRLLARQLAVLAPEPELALAILDRYERACLQEAEEAPAAPAQHASGATPAELAARLAAEESRLSLDAKLAWVEYARRELKRLSLAASTRP
jgi:DNA-binding PadR family transcriptional regulator